MFAIIASLNLIGLVTAQLCTGYDKPADEDAAKDTVKIVLHDNGECYVPLSLAKKSAVLQVMINETQDNEEIRLVHESVKSTSQFAAFLDLMTLPDIKINGPLRNNDLSSVISESHYNIVKDAIESKDVESLAAKLELANYMDVKSLVELHAASIASLLLGLTTTEMQELLKICHTEEERKNLDKCLSPEEIQKIREENRWIEELAM